MNDIQRAQDLKGETEAHACGHDFHAAMMWLTAAKILEENETALKATIRFIFQSAEDSFESANGDVCAIDPSLSGSLRHTVAGVRL